MTLQGIAEKLVKNHTLDYDEFCFLLENKTDEIAIFLQKEAQKCAQKNFGKEIYIRGLIEISNYCKNNCNYCGIRGSSKLTRYRLKPDEILQCAKEGYIAGFRTVVLQGGEDEFFTDDILCTLIKNIKSSYPDMAVTLSLGERSRRSYELLFTAGADRYLLRHETADSSHYSKLHPSGMSFENRIRCLYDLKETGFQTGCGFMVGSPYQTCQHIAKDLCFIQDFKPEMVGIGPFIPQKDTPFADFRQGTAELTLYLLSIIRLLLPRVLLPATTALGTIEADGQLKGFLHGANVCMPNLSPPYARDLYKIYDNKASYGSEALEGLNILKTNLEKIGYTVSSSRGDYSDK